MRTDRLPDSLSFVPQLFLSNFTWFGLVYRDLQRSSSTRLWLLLLPHLLLLLFLSQSLLLQDPRSIRRRRRSRFRRRICSSRNLRRRRRRRSASTRPRPFSSSDAPHLSFSKMTMAPALSLPSVISLSFSLAHFPSGLCLIDLSSVM